MEHGFNVNHAVKYGLYEAIFLKLLIFWINKNKANGRHKYSIEIDGQTLERTWTYNSMEAYKKIFPYFTLKQIRGTINRLRDKKIIITSQFNVKGYDKTLWYALCDEDSFLEGGLPEAVLVEKKTKVQGLKEPELFEQFWNQYHTHTVKLGRASAEKEWNKLTQPQRLKAVENITAYLNFVKVEYKDFKYQQKAQRYLKDKTFESDFKNKPTIFKDYD